jgi:sulfur carrier protein ThiS
MRIQVSLYAMQREKRLIDEFMDVHKNSTIQDLLRLLDVAIEEVAIVVVNGKSGTYKQTLLDGDRVTLIPPVSGG